MTQGKLVKVTTAADSTFLDKALVNSQGSKTSHMKYYMCMGMTT